MYKLYKFKFFICFMKIICRYCTSKIVPVMMSIKVVIRDIKKIIIIYTENVM